MPLLKIKEISPDCMLGIWKIEEDLNSLLLNEHVFAYDRQEFLAIHHPGKQKEWICARLLLINLLKEQDQEFKGIWKDSHGKPFLKGSPAFISITHSASYVACIIHNESAVGIDIEQLKPKIIRIKKKFLDSRELIETGDNIELLTKYWCGKEALYKLYGKKGIIFAEHLLINQKEVHFFGSIILENFHIHKKIHIENLEDYVLAYIL